MSQIIDKVRDKGFEITSSLELPADVIFSMPQIELIGDREIFIEGHKGISSYDENNIRLSCGRITVLINGSSLSIKYFSKESVRATGKIKSIEFLG